MPTAIAQLLATLIKPSHSWHLTLFSNWHSIMGTLSSKAVIEQIEGAVVTIGVYDACWLQELYLLTPLLRDRINQMLDQPEVKEIRFKRIVKKKERNRPHEKKITPKQAPALPLTSSEKDALKTIVDQDLQHALITFRTRCQRSF